MPQHITPLTIVEAVRYDEATFILTTNQPVASETWQGVDATVAAEIARVLDAETHVVKQHPLK